MPSSRSRARCSARRSSTWTSSRRRTAWGSTRPARPRASSRQRSISRGRVSSFFVGATRARLRRRRHRRVYLSTAESLRRRRAARGTTRASAGAIAHRLATTAEQAPDRAGALLDAEAVVDTGEVHFDGALADPELVGDLVVTRARAEQPGDLALPPGPASGR